MLVAVPVVIMLSLRSQEYEWTTIYNDFDNISFYEQAFGVS